MGISLSDELPILGKTYRFDQTNTKVRVEDIYTREGRHLPNGYIRTKGEPEPTFTVVVVRVVRPSFTRPKEVWQWLSRKRVEIPAHRFRGLFDPCR
jgi:hypothetical protein